VIGFSWLADASVILACEDSDDQHHLASIELLAGADSVGTLDLAFYEVTNVAIRAWRDASAAARLGQLVAALASDGELVRCDQSLLSAAAALASAHELSVYDAAYVAAARTAGARLVSCDLRDLVSRDLALAPADALVSRSPPGE
jgi:predicted nucleic acid-binding protein